MSFELSIPAAYAWPVWQQLVTTGASDNVAPIGMEALDVLRVEKGYTEVGVDTDGSTTPFDIGWGAAIARKPADFIGKRSLARSSNLTIDRLQLVGLIPVDRTQVIPAGSHILDSRSQRPEGHITSSCISPTLSCSVALAMLRSGRRRMGESVNVDVAGRSHPVQVVAPAFYDPKGARLRD